MKKHVLLPQDGDNTMYLTVWDDHPFTEMSVQSEEGSLIAGYTREELTTIRDNLTIFLEDKP